MTDTKARYEQLAVDREPFLRQARNAAALTIPALMPPEGHSKGAKLKHPYQSLGSRGVTHLSSSLLLSLMPPSQAFFRYQVDDRIRQQAEEAQAATAEQIDADLVATEKAIMGEFERWSVRTAAHEALKHIVVTGNALLHWPENGRPRIYTLDQYVVDRDANDTVLEIIVREMIAPEALPDGVRQQVLAGQISGEAVSSPTPGDRQHFEVYTVIRRQADGSYKLFKEVKGVVIPDSEGAFPADILPWIPNRFARISGEAYGRGFVEENFGDLASLNVLQRALLEASEQAARVLWLVKPNSSTKLRAVAEAPPGAVRPGNEDDVSCLQMDKAADMRVALEMRNELFQSLSAAFLLRQGVQRNAERVTAEEVRLVAQELEDSLGGVYSVQAIEFQLPLVRIAHSRLVRRGVIEKLPEGIAEPSIVTGLEALGRGHEIFALKGFLADIIQLPEAMQHLNARGIIAKFANGYGVAIQDVLLDEKQVAQIQQQAQLMELASKAAGPVASNLTSSEAQPAA